MVWEEFNCIGHSYTIGYWKVALVILVVLECWPNVEPLAGMFSPGFLFPSPVMDGYFATRWCQWCCIVVKVPMDHCISG